MSGPVSRRGVLQSGAFAGALSLVGLGGSHAEAHPALSAAGRRDLDMIAAHIRLDLARGATIRVVELDSSQRAVRDFAMTQVPVAALYAGGIPTRSGDPVGRVCERAQALAVQAAAQEWRVPASGCRADPAGIVHPASGRRAAYRAWIDIV